MTITTEDATKELFELARRAPFNIAPEKAKRLAEDIFGEGEWTIRTSKAEANFFAVPEDKAIYLPYAGLASLWCLSYVAFYVVDIASNRQRSESHRDETGIQIGDLAAALRLGEYLAYARVLFHHDQEWPNNLVKPDAGAALSTQMGRINNVFLGALSWIMLHEIAHVHHGDQKCIPVAQQVSQEYKADDFATRWVLEEAGAGISNEFRVLMVCIALTWLLLHELEMGKGRDHPDTILRLREAVHYFRTSERSVGLENAGYVFKAVLDPITPPPVANDAKDMFDWVMSRLEILFAA